VVQNFVLHSGNSLARIFFDKSHFRGLPSFAFNGKVLSENVIQRYEQGK
jgi:hypothetical protein